MTTVTPSTSADGTPVAEVELVPGRLPDLADLVGQARAQNAAVLWAYTPDDLEQHGFAETPGFVRLEGSPSFDEVPDDDEQVVVLADEDEVRTLRRACFVGRFGHKMPSASRPAIRSDHVHLGLRLAGQTVGTCRVEPAHRYVDAPGVLPEHRTPRRYVRLLRAAAELLGDGPITVEGWGEPAEIVASYARTGLRVVAHVPGWQRGL
ncbi:MAG TPA: hypothetical protein VLA97_13205 [Nocardioidaceae bacterium]|nr:hypothetical protein [Nocardioidaceae bacterium]